MARIGIGYDVHALAPGRTLRLGGVDVPHDRGLAGHSDGDAAVHAVADAILGALRWGDLGAWFPSEDPALEGIDSLRFLEKIAARMRDEGWKIGNIDVVIVAQEPRLAPHVEAMSRAMAAALAIEPARVSVHSKSADRLGTIGRGEGIAAMAVALVHDGREDPDG